MVIKRKQFQTEIGLYNRKDNIKDSATQVATTKKE